MPYKGIGTFVCEMKGAKMCLKDQPHSIGEIGLSAISNTIYYIEVVFEKKEHEDEQIFTDL